MNLYGKLVDQNGKPVAGAVVHFDAMKYNQFQLPILFGSGGETVWPVQAPSMADGTFVVKAGWGQVLWLKSIEGRSITHAGTYSSFHFGRNPPEQPVASSPSHPAITLCWNYDYKLVLKGRIQSKIGNEKYVVGLRSGRFSPFGTGDEDFIVQITRPAIPTNDRFDWSIEVEGMHLQIPTLRDSPGPLSSSAPKGGYTASLHYNTTADSPAWSSQRNVRFYLTRENIGQGGRRIYAGVDLTAVVGSAGAATVTIEYSADFGGSTDLTPGPASSGPE